MENGLGKVVNEAATYRNGHFPYALLAAGYHKDMADNAALDGKSRFARTLYKRAMREFVESRHYQDAFDMAKEHDLLPQLKRIFDRRKQYLEKIGLLEDCLAIDELTKHKKQESGAVQT